MILPTRKAEQSWSSAQVRDQEKTEASFRVKNHSRRIQETQLMAQASQAARCEDRQGSVSVLN